MDHVEQLLQRDPLAVDQQLVPEVEDPQIAEHLALVGEEGGVAPAARLQAEDVVGHLALQEVLGLAPVSASLPRSERSTTNVVTDETLALFEARQPPRDLALELVQHALAREPASSAERTTAASSAPSSRSSRASRPSRSKGMSRPCTLCAEIMPLADEFQELLDALPSDWTDLELDLRVQEDRYIDAAHAAGDVQRPAVFAPRLALPSHRRPPVRARGGGRDRPGHAALLDEAGIAGELVLREVRDGRVETVQMWGRPESVRQEFRRIRSQ